MSEVYILCEGYHDRAFWKGLLLSVGCTDPGQNPGGTRRPTLDPWQLEVKGGQFGFFGPSEKFIRVVPAGGRGNVLRLARNRLKARQQKKLSHLVINCDSDQNADGSKSLHSELQVDTVFAMVKEFDPQATQTDGFTLSIDGGATIVHSFPWRASDPPAIGLPNQQTLERVTAAAMVAAYPTRGQAVEDWLASRPEPPRATAKEHALSYLAGWYAERGSYEAFCEAIWLDAEIKRQLQRRMIDQGVWQHLFNAIS